MSVAWLIARNDWRRQYAQPFAWVLLALVGALLAWQFLLAVDAFLRMAPKLGALSNAPGVTDLVAMPLLASLSNLLLLVVPLATMHSLAGERRAGTLPLLLAAGVGDGAIVLGKFLGALGLVVPVLLIAQAMPLTLAAGSELDLGRLAAAAIGLLLYAGALTAIGVLCSAWTAQPVLAGVATLVLTSLLGLLDVGARLQGVQTALVNWLALPTHLEPFLRGLIASGDVVYFLLLTGFALALAARRLGSLRGRG